MDKLQTYKIFTLLLSLLDEIEMNTKYIQISNTYNTLAHPIDTNILKAMPTRMLIANMKPPWAAQTKKNIKNKLIYYWNRFVVFIRYWVPSSISTLTVPQFIL